MSTSTSTSSPADSFIQMMCDQCNDNFTFDSITDLNEHLQHVHFACTACKTSPMFESELMLLRHLRSKHPAIFMNK